MNKINKKYLIAVIVIIFVLIGRALLLREPSHELTITTTRGTLVDKVVVSGVYTTAAQTEVASPTRGIISKLYVENNDDVQKGDPLFYVESSATDEEKALAYANYQKALNSLRVAKQNKENVNALMFAKQKAFLDAQNSLNHMNDNLADDTNNPATGDEYTDLEINSTKAAVEQTEKDFRAIEKQYKEADGSITSAQASLASSKLTYDATKSILVKAPAGGRVVNLLKKVGDSVAAGGDGAAVGGGSSAAGSATQTAPPVLIVANLESPSMLATISEAYIARLMEGQEAEIVFDAVRDQTFTGHIEAIDTVGTDTNGVITYNARITLDDVTPNIKPNMTGTITIETFRKDDVVSVPGSAILFKDEKAYVKEPGKKGRLIEVELGERGLVETEIVGGLTENMEILANINSN